jgi:hypothetical protein
VKSIPGKYTGTISINDEIAFRLYVNIFEAVVNYPVMHLNVDVKTTN